MGKFSAGRLIDFHYVKILIFGSTTVVGFTPRLRFYFVGWYCFRSFFQDSTDEDAARFALSQEIAVIESEYELLAGRRSDVDDGGESGKDDGTTEGQLQIVESSAEIPQESSTDDTATLGDGQPDGGAMQPSRKVAGSGEIDAGSSDDDDFDDEAVGDSRLGADDLFDDDALFNNSSGSDARHDVDYLHDQHGGLLSYLLMAS